MESLVTQTKPHSAADCNAIARPLAHVLGRIGTRWTIHVIIALTQGPMRFSELKRHVAGISQKMLTQTLRDLEADGLVTRTVTPIIPPRVDYELTAMGMELRIPLAGIAEWATRHSPAITRSRANHAQADG